MLNDFITSINFIVWKYCCAAMHSTACIISLYNNNNTMVAVIMIKRSTATIPACDFQSNGPIAAKIIVLLFGVPFRTRKQCCLFTGDIDFVSFGFVADLCRSSLPWLSTATFNSSKYVGLNVAHSLLRYLDHGPGPLKYSRYSRCSRSRIIGPEYLGRARKGASLLGVREKDGYRGGGRPQSVICVIYTSHEHCRVYNRAYPFSTAVITHRYPS